MKWNQRFKFASGTTIFPKFDSFKEFLIKHNLKNEATSNLKIQEVLNKLGIKAGIFMRDSNITNEIAIVNLHPTKGTHWVLVIHNFYFDSYGCPPPKNVLKHVKSEYNKCIYSEYRIQKQDSLCANYCLYIIYLYHKLGSFKKAVMNLYYLKNEEN